MMQVVGELCHVDRCTHGCNRDTGCLGLAFRQIAPEHYLSRAQALVAEAESYGVVITIEQCARYPLAMGHHETVVTTRRARVLAEQITERAE